MTIPSFRRHAAPRLGANEGERVRKKEPYRGSRQSRGYDRDWELLAAKYKKAVKGRCEECARRGYLAFGDVVDHMEPITDNPERRLDWSNLDFLCHSHHNGLKRRIEEYARKTGATRLLSQWMKFPETRPIAFQIMKRGPLAELFDEESEAERSAAGE
jgi:5-methylcytosine-specific restriction endonuclease McrA